MVSSSINFTLPLSVSKLAFPSTVVSALVPLIIASACVAVVSELTDVSIDVDEEVSSVLFVDVKPPQEIIADDDNATNKHCNMCLICTCFIIEILLNEKIINAQISYHPNNSKEKFSLNIQTWCRQVLWIQSSKEIHPANLTYQLNDLKPGNYYSISVNDKIVKNLKSNTNGTLIFDCNTSSNPNTIVISVSKL